MILKVSPEPLRTRFVKLLDRNGFDLDPFSISTLCFTLPAEHRCAIALVVVAMSLLLFLNIVWLKLSAA